MIVLANIFYNNIHENIKKLYSSLNRIAGKSHSEDEENSSFYYDPDYPNLNKDTLDKVTKDFEIDDPELEEIASGEIIDENKLKYRSDREEAAYRNMLAYINLIKGDERLRKLQKEDPAKYDQIIKKYQQRLQNARNLDAVYKNFVREMAEIDAIVNPKLPSEISEKYKKIKKIKEKENIRNPGSYEDINIDLKPFKHRNDTQNFEEILYKKKLILDKIDSLLSKVELYRDKVNPAFQENANSFAVEAYEEIENVYRKLMKYRSLFVSYLDHIEHIKVKYPGGTTQFTETLKETPEEIEIELGKINRYVDQISADIDAYEQSYEELKAKAAENKFLVGYISKYVNKGVDLLSFNNTKNFGTEFFTNAYSAVVDADPRIGSDEYFGYEGLDISNEEEVYKFFTEGAPERRLDFEKEDIVTFKCAIPYSSIDWEKMDQNYKELGTEETDPLMHVIYVKPGAKVILLSAFYNDRDVEQDNISLNKSIVTASKLPSVAEFIKLAYRNIKIYHDVELERYSNHLDDSNEYYEESYSVDFWQERDRVSVIVTNNLTEQVVFEAWDEDVINDIDLGLYQFGDADSVLEYLRSVGMIK
jgi:hypothetical protein